MTPNVFNLVRCIFYLYKSHRGHRFCIVVRHKHAGQLMLHTSISYIYINLHFQNKQHGNRKMAIRDLNTVTKSLELCAQAKREH